MEPYLLKRRLRHVRSVKISNLCAGHKNSQESIWFPSYFMVIENGRGQTIYVSEVQRGSFYSVQFNELPAQDSPLTHFTLKLVAEVPKWLLPSSDEKLWFNFRTYHVDLNQAKRINSDDIVESYNVLVLELVDGNYVSPSVSVLAAPKESIGKHKRAASAMKNKNSFTFNYILKLNKILEYTSQVMEESQQTSERVETQVQDEHRKHQWLITHLRKYNRELQSRIQKKRLDLQRLRNYIDDAAELEEKDFQPYLLNDYYGNTYPHLIQNRSRLESLRTKKLAQLIGIFRTTDLFDVRAGFVTFDGPLQDPSSSSLYNRFSLEFLNKTKLLELATSGSDANKKMTSSCLGYYAIFVTLVATSICNIPLPHSLMYCGSTTTINGTAPLYLDNIKDTDLLSRAIDCFNGNIVQIIQFLKHRQTQ